MNNERSNTTDQRIREILHEKMVSKIKKLSQGASSGFFCEHNKDIDVRLWMKEFGGCNVTLFLDSFLESPSITEKLFNKEPDKKGTIYLFTGEERSAAHYISVLSLDGQSSGVRVLDSFKYENEGVLTLEVNPLLVKQSLIVPEDPFDGFCWSSNTNDGVIKTTVVPTSVFGKQFILNFAVCGEFNLSIFYVADGSDTPQHLFSKGFCCK